MTRTDSMDVMRSRKSRTLNHSFNIVTLNDAFPKILVAKQGNVSSLHLKKNISKFEHKNETASIDYCNNAVDLLCAIEDKFYDILFVDYCIDNIDLFALLKFLSIQCPKAKVVLMSAPIWNTANEKEKVIKLCNTCCHEGFYDLDIKGLRNFVLKTT